MNINKAIRKQNKSYIRFMLTMGFIFILLPEALFLSNKWKNPVFLIFLLILEMLIIVSMLTVSNSRLCYTVMESSIKVKLGIYLPDININFDRVKAVHTESCREKMMIVLLTSSNLRSKYVKKIDNNFLKQFPDLTDISTKFSENGEQNDFYYFVISYGGYNKYELLNEIYKTCVRAYFTDEAIECIKEYRKWNN